MCVADRIAALLEGLSREDLDRLPPARLKRFSDLCYHWHQLAERRLRPQPAESGVLSRLRDGERSD